MSIQIQIREETPADYSQVFNIIQQAFEQMPQSGHNEQFLVERLRESNAFIPELSLVATIQDKVVGHILLTQIYINTATDQIQALALAPVSVNPQYQRQGIGGLLIKASHHKAKTMGYSAIALIGHEAYYPRFGYRAAHCFNIKFPFEAPDDNCMILELKADALKNIQGQLEYPQEFFI